MTDWTLAARFQFFRLQRLLCCAALWPPLAKPSVPDTCNFLLRKQVGKGAWFGGP